jgi:tetratricopeptide (TPR) repeat protein
VKFESKPHGFRVVGLSALVIACLLLTAWSRESLHRLPKDSTTRLKEVLMIPPGRVVRQLDLGYHSLAADLLFIRANLYYGQHILTDEQLPWMANFIDILLAVDPKFKKAYLWGALSTTFYKRQIDHVPDELVMQANRILESGMKQFPDDYRFPMRIAYNLYYERGDPDRAIPYFNRAAHLPGAPTWLREALVNIYTKKGQKEMARKTLSELMLETEDPMLAKALRDRMAQLMDEPERLEMTSHRRELIDAWKTDYSYMPFDLYLLIREQ